MKIDKPVEIQPPRTRAARRPAGAARPAPAPAQARGGTADSVSLGSSQARRPTRNRRRRGAARQDCRSAKRSAKDDSTKAQVVADTMIAQAAEHIETLTVPKR